MYFMHRTKMCFSFEKVSSSLRKFEFTSLIYSFLFFLFLSALDKEIEKMFNRNKIYPRTSKYLIKKKSFVN